MQECHQRRKSPFRKKRKRKSETYEYIDVLFPSLEDNYKIRLENKTPISTFLNNLYVSNCEEKNQGTE